MPSFDIVSKIDSHELTNAIDQANREVQNRFDFKGSNANFTLDKQTVSLLAPSDFQLKQMNDILCNKLSKRNIDLRTLEYKDPEVHLHEAKQEVQIKEGIDQAVAKQIVKLLKDAKLKVQAAIQGDQIRVTGNKKDDLQSAIALLRESKLTIPVQFINYRD
ncbi:MAG: YajQ family cyclic di-GMP-binding protein [Gammaproteobacteria bacterium GWE2_42_36]|nr:MAG: YajQ family cyclic di-GMP-binding protein [Gammaproteobacteria bacterium GWE2_42_36]HCU05677.1 YajQ family cyclic di-GMP-binding protein [Coxiellaceae bacterium]